MRRKILTLAIPNIVTNITVPLVGIADLAIAGRMGDETLLAAVVIGTTIFNFIYWLFGFLRMGTSGFTSQAYGAENFAETIRVLIRSVCIALFFSLLILFFQIPIARFSCIIMDSSQVTEDLALQYFFARIWGAPAVLMVYSLKGWFIGMQNPKIPMWMAIIINIMNIVSSLYFVFDCNMGVVGLGFGSAIGQWSGVLFAIMVIIRRYRHLFDSVEINEIIKKEPLIKFFKVNADIFIRTLCLVSVFTYFTIASSKSGDTFVAANALLLQLFIIFSYMMDGFAYAAESLSGKFYGAGDKENLKNTTVCSIEWGVYLSIAVTFIYAIFIKQILGIFNPSDTVLAIAMHYKWYVILIPVCSFTAFLLDGILVGVTASKIMRNVMIASTVAFFFLFFALYKYIENDALWIAFLVYLFLRGFLQFILSRKILFLK